MLSWIRVFPILVLIFTLIQTASAVKLPRPLWKQYTLDDYQIYACQKAVNANNTRTVGFPVFKKKLCKNTSFMGSLMTCLYENNHINDTAIENRLIEMCAANNATLTPEQLRSVYFNATNYVVNISTKAEYAKVNINTTVIAGPYVHKKYVAYSHSLYARYQTMNYSHYMGAGALGFWAVVVFVSTLKNWIDYLLLNKKKGGIHFLNNKIVNFYRKHVTLAPTFREKHVQNVGLFGYLPDRTESILIAVWTLYCVLCTFILGVKHYDDDAVYPIADVAYGKYYGDRSGVLLSYILPLLFLFPGRNNFLQWLTRWEYKRFVHIHKWIGRVVFFEILVHTIAYSIQSVASGKIAKRLLTLWFRAGIVSTVASFLLILSASYIVRRYSYEVFIVSHIVLTAVFISTAYVHTVEQWYQDFYLAAIMVWAFDRFCRLVRIALFGVSTAKIQLVGESTIKVTMKHSKFWQPTPGSHCWVHFLTFKHFYQSHPFSVVINESNEIVFYCKAIKGVTDYLYKRLLKSENLSFELKCLVEGPYGNTTPFHHYDKSVMITGGNGVTGLYAYAQNLCERYGSGEKKQIKFYWSVRNLEVLNWFRDELFRLRDAQDFCKVIIYVSQFGTIVDLNSISTSTDSDNSSSTGEKKSEFSEDKRVASMELIKPNTSMTEIQEMFDFIEFKEGRMDIDTIIDSEVAESERNSSMAISVCAAPAVNDMIRRRVRNHLTNANDVSIDFFEQIQTW